MKTITPKELDVILANHFKWLKKWGGGVKADLSYTDLRGLDFKGAKLECAHLEGADFEGADLEYCHLRYANLGKTNFRGANLKGADLRETNALLADFRRANLKNTDFRAAHLKEAKFAGSNRDMANFACADVTGTILEKNANEPQPGIFLTSEPLFTGKSFANTTKLSDEQSQDNVIKSRKFDTIERAGEAVKVLAIFGYKSTITCEDDKWVVTVQD